MVIWAVVLYGVEQTMVVFSALLNPTIQGIKPLTLTLMMLALMSHVEVLVSCSTQRE